MVSIAATLSQSAGLYAKRALEAYVSDDLSDFALFAGIAVEKAAKAKLAMENASFIAPVQPFRAAIALHRAAGDVSRLPSGTRTVGGIEALRRLYELHPELRQSVEPAEELVRLRNGEAHLGSVNVTFMRRALIAFLRATEALLQVEPEELWGPHSGLVRTSLDEQAQAIEHDIAERLAAALVRFGRGVGAFGQEQLNAMIQVFEARRDSRVDNEEALPFQCPACGSPALMMGYTEQTDWEVDYGDEGPEGAWPVLTFFAGGLSCEACGLELDGSDELTAAGLDTFWVNQDVDLDNWMAEQYDPSDE